jgi:GT2 family glycosyltransferase
MHFVSILIPCYNAEQWIGEAIQSALDQTHPNKEVIVVDDGSTDGSLDVIRSFGQQILWETGPNRGGNAARNRLLELSKGTWLQYVDADDYLLPAKISNQLFHAREDTDIVFSPTLFEEWSTSGKQTHVYAEIPAPHEPWTLLAFWKLPQTGGPLFRRDAIVAAGGWNENRGCCQEHDLYFRLLRAGAKSIFTLDALAVYRYWSTDSVSRKNSQQLLCTKLDVLNTIEEHLLSTGQLSPERLDAISFTRFATARMLWPIDSNAALRAIKVLCTSNPGFRPKTNAAYTFLFSWLGFHMAETIAIKTRKLRSMIRR